MDYFHWDMDHMLLPISGEIGIRWYSTFFLIGFLLSNYFMIKFVEKEGRDARLVDPLLFYCVIGTVVGARLAHCLFYGFDYYSQNILEIFMPWKGGLASHGGFTGVMLAIFLFSRKYKQWSFFYVVDRVAILAIMVGGFIRIGNFFNSEIVGKISTVPWAVIFDKVDQMPRHPTQLYEAVGYWSLSLVMYLVYRVSDRNPLGGRVLGVGFVGGYGFRFLIEHLKENQEVFESGMFFNMGQLLSLPFVPIGLYLIWGLQKKSKALEWAFHGKAQTR